MKFKNISVWIPLLGIIFMMLYTEFGRYSTIYFAGQIWKLYQFICGFLLLILI